MERIQVSDVAQINELWNEYAASINAGDMERWISLWIEDGLQMPPDAVRRAGKELIREGNRPLFELFDAQMAVYPDEIHVLGDHAYSHGLYEYILTAKEGDDVVKGNGKFLTILQRQTDGSWKIVIDCFNNDAPPG